MLGFGLDAESKLEGLENGHARAEQVALDPMLDLRLAFDLRRRHPHHDR